MEHNYSIFDDVDKLKRKFYKRDKIWNDDWYVSDFVQAALIVHRLRDIEQYPEFYGALIPFMPWYVYCTSHHFYMLSDSHRNTTRQMMCEAAAYSFLKPENYFPKFKNGFDQLFLSHIENQDIIKRYNKLKISTSLDNNHYGSKTRSEWLRYYIRYSDVLIEAKQYS